MNKVYVLATDSLSNAKQAKVGHSSQVSIRKNVVQYGNGKKLIELLAVPAEDSYRVEQMILRTFTPMPVGYEWVQVDNSFRSFIKWAQTQDILTPRSIAQKLYELVPYKVRTYSTKQVIRSLSQLPGLCFSIPTLQRNEVWSQEKREELISTIIHGGAGLIQELTAAKTTKGIAVLDGQQRLTTILSYMNDEFTCKEMYYSELPKGVKKLFNMSSIKFLVYTNLPRSEWERTYNKLNNGTALKTGEKLKACGHPSGMWINKMADKYISQLVNGNRQAHLEKTAKVVSMIMDLHGAETTGRQTRVSENRLMSIHNGEHSSTLKQLKPKIEFCLAGLASGLSDTRVVDHKLAMNAYFLNRISDVRPGKLRNEFFVNLTQFVSDTTDKLSEDSKQKKFQQMLNQTRSPWKVEPKYVFFKNAYKSFIKKEQKNKNITPSVAQKLLVA